MEVKAELMGEVASKSDVAFFNAEEIKEAVIELSAKLDKASKVHAELYMTDDDLMQSDLADVKRQRTYINETIRAAEDSRKSLKRMITKSYDTLEPKYKEALQPLRDLELRYKAEVDGRAERLRAERYELLFQAFRMYPLSSVIELDTLLSVRDNSKLLNKSTNEVKAVDSLCEEMERVAREVEQLHSMELFDSKAAEADYYRCLDIGLAIIKDNERREEQARIEELNARVAMAREPEIIQAEPEVIQAEPEIIEVPNLVTYLIAAEMTLEQGRELVAFFKQQGIKGRAVPRRDLTLYEAEQVVRNVK